MFFPSRKYKISDCYFELFACNFKSVDLGVILISGKLEIEKLIMNFGFSFSFQKKVENGFFSASCFIFQESEKGNIQNRVQNRFPFGKKVESEFFSFVFNFFLHKDYM